jgi:perosamine synthetase
MTNLQAALGVAQVEKIDRTIDRKRWIASQYNKHLNNVSELTLPIEKPWAKNIYWMYAVVISEKTGIDADQLAKLLKTRGIETRPFFMGMHEQPVFKKNGFFGGEKYPVAEKISRQGLYLPSSLNLTESEIQQICDAVKEIVAGNSYGNL